MAELPAVVRDALFDAHFDQGMDMRGALAFVRLMVSVTILPEQAARLIREEEQRRKVIAEAAHSETVADAIQRRGVQRTARQLVLEPRGKHQPKLDFVKGKVLVTCTCGGTVGRFERGAVHDTEVAWFQHRDGGTVWKKG